MARLADEEIERLKKEVPLEALVAASGVELQRAGADLVGRCPFHDDREPSLVVSPGKNLWHCLGACQAGGSAIDWVMRAQGVSFRHAVELLRSGQAGSRRDGPAPARSTVRRLSSPVGPDAGDAEALAQVVDYYHATLLGSPDALAYLRSRRVDDPEALEVSRLGYANRTLSYRLPTKERKEGAELRGRLQRLGVFRSSGHEHFNGCVVVPIFDSSGVVVEMYGRKLDWDRRTGQAAHLYLPGPHRGVWNEEGLAGGEVIICESLIDALSFWCAGFHNVTAAYGTAGFTDEHRAAFCRHHVAKVFIAYDHDPAGDAAAQKLAAELSSQGTECLRVTFPYGTDANDAAVASDNPQRELGQFLARAHWLSGPPALPRLPAQPLTGTAAAPLDGAAHAPATAPPGPSRASAFLGKEMDLTPSAFGAWPKRGTFVRPRSDWNWLHPLVLSWSQDQHGDVEFLKAVAQIRRDRRAKRRRHRSDAPHRGRSSRARCGPPCDGAGGLGRRALHSGGCEVPPGLVEGDPQ